MRKRGAAEGAEDQGRDEGKGAGRPSISQRRQSVNLSDRKEADRIEKLCAHVSKNSPPWLAGAFKAAAPAVRLAGQAALVAGPVVISAAKSGYAMYKVLPTQIIAMGYGLSLCFFGGMYPLSLAAVEAFRATGGDRMAAAAADLMEDLETLAHANAEDDKKDDDGDGIKDVDQISAQELLTRKAGLALRTIDPDRFTQALEGLYSGIWGVLVVLKFRFARTVSLALSIGNFMRPLAAQIVAPSMALFIPPAYQQWIMPVVNYSCKAIAMSIAWYIQRIISTVQSAINGGLMFSRAAMRFASKKGLVHIDPDDSFLDEIVGWTLALGGAYFQITIGWDLPFAVDLLLSPLHVLEGALRWSVTWLDAPRGV